MWHHFWIDWKIFCSHTFDAFSCYCFVNEKILKRITKNNKWREKSIRIQCSWISTKKNANLFVSFRFCYSKWFSSDVFVWMKIKTKGQCVIFSLIFNCSAGFKTKFVSIDNETIFNQIDSLSFDTEYDRWNLIRFSFFIVRCQWQLLLQLVILHRDRWNDFKLCLDQVYSWTNDEMWRKGFNVEIITINKRNKEKNIQDKVRTDLVMIRKRQNSARAKNESIGAISLKMYCVFIFWVDFVEENKILTTLVFTNELMQSAKKSQG